MASNSKSPLLLLGILVLFITKVSSYDEDLVNQDKYTKAPVSAVAPVVAPTPSPAPKPSTPPTAPVGKAPTPPPTTGHPVAPAPQPPVNAPVTPAPAPAAPIVRSNKDCVPLCENRCQLHSRKRVCIRACSTCCERCKCVPPGTYGNREVCGKCYTDMVTHGNRYKCP
ncbi:gibberellin-regulated protein 14 [Neltuma alba]|uniref:gibberellin-regulated protein 14 n=1 Tax=Neltuma alba TaxID=207710 RepID=UPI0010A43C7F|nr:gibberellin-regulated protein 14-like [Prosopis alba]